MVDPKFEGLPGIVSRSSTMVGVIIHSSDCLKSQLETLCTIIHIHLQKLNGIFNV